MGLGDVMAGANAQRVANTDDGADDLFARIGVFLREQRLSPDPQHYAFAYRVLSEAQGALARIVAEKTEGGVRLLRQDIEQLGGSVAAGAAVDGQSPAAGADIAEGLVARTQMQVDGFTDMVQAMRAETEDFGRDLAASADAMCNDATLDPDAVVRLTASMLVRVRSAETRLEQATHEASELREELEEARNNARRDPLTDLPNRRAFEEAFAARAAGEQVCVAVCDVDHFKAVNDRFGHAVGDRVLKAIADALSQGCDGQMVSRYGGEEFAIMFTGVALEDAAATLEEARAVVAAKRYRLRGTDQPIGEITFSAGLTVAEDGETRGTVVGRADKLLYTAKNAGRNQLKIG